MGLHLLGGIIGNLARRRDRHSPFALKPGEDVPELVNRINCEWMAAARRISPRVLIDLIALTGPQLADYFTTLDLEALGEPVTWAGPGRAPVWLDVAREYTEWWHHQQHIRDAVGQPGLDSARYLVPTLATFAHALPVAFQDVSVKVGTTAVLSVPDIGDWTVRRVGHGWRLYEGAAPKPTARAVVNGEHAWRLFTRGLPPERAGANLEGDEALAARLLRAEAIL